MLRIHSMSAPNKRGILQSKENHAHVIHGPKEHNQGVCVLLWMMVMDTYIYPTTHLQHMKDTYTYPKALH